jgi:hypothetical protein
MEVINIVLLYTISHREANIWIRASAPFGCSEFIAVVDMYNEVLPT